MKTILILGATGAIGSGVVRTFAIAGYKVIMGVRNIHKANQVKTAILKEKQNAEIFILQINMNDFKSIDNALAELQKFNTLDIIVNCASTFNRTIQINSYDIEEMFMVNYLSFFYLTNMLINKFSKGNSIKIINMAAPNFFKIDFDDLQQRKNFKMMKAYQSAMVCREVYIHELSVKRKNIQFTSLNFYPGFVKNESAKKATGIMGFMIRFMALFAGNSDKAAKALLEIASTPIEQIKSQYYKMNKPAKPQSYWQNEEVGQRLWNESEKLISELSLK